MHPDDSERVSAEIERTRQKGEDFRLEYRMIAADGRVVWVLDSTVVVRDEQYRPIVLQGFVVDVTAQVERASAESIVSPASMRAS